VQCSLGDGVLPAEGVSRCRGQLRFATLSNVPSWGTTRPCVAARGHHTMYLATQVYRHRALRSGGPNSGPLRTWRGRTYVASAQLIRAMLAPSCVPKAYLTIAPAVFDACFHVSSSTWTWSRVSIGYPCRDDADRTADPAHLACCHGARVVSWDGRAGDRQRRWHLGKPCMGLLHPPRMIQWQQPSGKVPKITQIRRATLLEGGISQDKTRITQALIIAR
jgi:hypothetical protein